MAERIHVLGVGPGSAEPELPPRTALVVGARRHLDALTAPAGGTVRTVAFSGDLEPALAAIGETDGEAVVLASGDPGLFGIVRVLAERFGRECLHVVPAVSAVAAVCAAVGVPWDDAVIVSAHGREPATAVAACLAHPKVVVLTAPAYPPARLAGDLLDAGAASRRIVVGERLGGPDEQVATLDLDGVAAREFAEPNVALVLDRAGTVAESAPTLAGAGHVPDRWGLPVAAFEHHDGLITKPEVRALALAHLAPRTGRLVWDVGAGSGAVGIECARFGAAVVAVEQGSVAALRSNADRHEVALRVVQGTAPEALADLPDPDAVFVGGGGARLPEILEVVASRTRDRVAVALASLERVAPAAAALDDAGWRTRTRLVQIQDLAPLGEAHRLAPHNPVFLVLGDRP